MICDKLNMPNLFFLLAVLLSTGSSGWFLPSMWQWKIMINNFGGVSSFRDIFNEKGGRNLFRQQYGPGYWSCSETTVDPRTIFYINFYLNGTSVLGSDYKSNTKMVRSIVAF